MYLMIVAEADRKGRFRRPKRWSKCQAELAALMKALGHPVRVKVIRTLSQKQRCPYGTMASALGLAQSTVSQRLEVLRSSGLVRR